MLLPFWTDGCIGSMEGLYFEASGTTPYHFLTSAAISAAQLATRCATCATTTLDVDKGVEYMQPLGVQYYMAFTPAAVMAKADASSRTSLPIATVRAVGDLRGRRHRHRHAAHDPAGRRQGRRQGPRRHGCAGPRHVLLPDPAQWAVDAGRERPPNWQRVALVRDGRPRPTLATVTPAPVARRCRSSNVSDGTTTTRSRFDVDQVGVPGAREGVSYFPNWQVSRRRGAVPGRAEPDGRRPDVAHDVTLHYGRTPVDYFAYVPHVARASPALVVAAAAAGRVVYPVPPRPEEPLDRHERSRRSSGTTWDGVEWLRRRWPSPITPTEEEWSDEPQSAAGARRGSIRATTRPGSTTSTAPMASRRACAMPRNR